MHQVQKHILKVLTLQEYARFAELRPARTDSNLFSYHLKSLLLEGLVDKVEAGYTLSADGLFYVDHVSLEKFEPRLQPKIITILVLQDKNGRVLVQPRQKQPFINQLALPNGKVHLGESPLEAAKREVGEKIGIDNVNLCHIGDVYVHHYQDEVLLSSILGHVMKARVEDVDTARGEWFADSEMQQLRLLPTTIEVIDLALRAKEHFFRVLVAKH